jgi:UDPglucose 6-dehydrogenase
MTLKLSVIGLGKLGAPMLAVFAYKGFDVIGVDLNESYVAAINAGQAPVEEDGLADLISKNRERIRATTDFSEAVFNSDISFIIVPTPSDDDFFFKNDHVIAALDSIGSALRKKKGYHAVVITSTVMPGSTGGILRETLERASGRTVGPDLGLCYNPEFIALGTVVQDMLNPDMILIGESDSKVGDLLEGIYRESTESHPEFQRMNWVNAEICKIAVNTYVTTKISYANMIAEMCDHLQGAHVDVVTTALGADSRIGKKYIKGGIAYGGPCFPRDNKAFSALGRQLGVRCDLAEATDLINDHQLKRLERAVTHHCSPGTTVAILGLAYKPNTPVIEESQGLRLALALVQKGFKIITSDPQARLDHSKLSGLDIDFSPSAQTVIESAEAIIIMTPWPEYENLAPSIFGRKVVIDPWRLFPMKSLLPSTRHIHLGVGETHSTAHCLSSAA